MRDPLLAVAVALVCRLLIAAPARAEQPADPLAALARAGAPLVAAVLPTSAGPTPPARPMAASATAPFAPEPGTAPAIGIPGTPNPVDALGGLDARGRAAAFLDGVVSVLRRELPGAMRGCIDGALGFGASSRSFVKHAPAEGSYESPTVRSLWDFSRVIANAGLALVVMWGGFRQHIGSLCHGEPLPRVLAALAVNLTLEPAEGGRSAMVGVVRGRRRETGSGWREDARGTLGPLALLLAGVALGVVLWRLDGGPPAPSGAHIREVLSGTVTR